MEITTLILLFYLNYVTSYAHHMVYTPYLFIAFYGPLTITHDARVLRDLQLDLEPVSPALFMVDHIGHLPEAEDHPALTLGVDLRVVPALGTEGPDGHLLVGGTPYLKASTLFTERSHAAGTFGHRKVGETDATTVHVIAGYSHRRCPNVI